MASLGYLVASLLLVLAILGSFGIIVLTSTEILQLIMCGAILILYSELKDLKDS